MLLGKPRLDDLKHLVILNIGAANPVHVLPHHLADLVIKLILNTQLFRNHLPQKSLRIIGVFNVKPSPPGEPADDTIGDVFDLSAIQAHGE